ncbi:MAG: hypothetical protein EOO57_12820 [Hymenobacter sp.]|nr:MAG: hypothetical protein EOO57_12820 [Hymenobacter sp.]
MFKTILSAAALSCFFATAALAQTTPMSTSDGGDKTKQVVDGMTVKTKVDPSDGKMKVKGKDDAGNRMKAYTKPRKGDMKMDGDMSMKGDRKMNRKGMKKGMRRDSMRQGSM